MRPGELAGRPAGTNRATCTTGSGYALDSSTGSELIVTLAWRSAETAAIASAALLLLSLIVRRYYRAEARLNERVIAIWRPLLTRVALEQGDPPTFPRLPGSHRPFLMEEWN